MCKYLKGVIYKVIILKTKPSKGFSSFFLPTFPFIGPRCGQKYLYIIISKQVRHWLLWLTIFLCEQAPKRKYLLNHIEPINHLFAVNFWGHSFYLPDDRGRDGLSFWEPSARSGLLVFWYTGPCLQIKKCHQFTWKNPTDTSKNQLYRPEVLSLTEIYCFRICHHSCVKCLHQAALIPALFLPLLHAVYMEKCRVVWPCSFPWYRNRWTPGQVEWRAIMGCSRGYLHVHVWSHPDINPNTFLQESVKIKMIKKK